MKILHIITRLIVGGAQENTLLTCAGQHGMGHEVTLLTGPSLGAEGSLMGRAEGEGYAVKTTPHLVRNPHPKHDAKAYFAIKRLCEETRPDVVHTHSSKAGILGRMAAWDARVPVVVHTVHGLPFHPYQPHALNVAWIALERMAAERCHAIISVADAMTRQALAAGVGTKDQYTTVYSGMDVGPFLQPGVTREEVRGRLGVPQDAVVFATIARLQPLKGHDDLLKVAGEVIGACPRAHFLWIGDGVYRERFEKTIAERGWRGHFTLTGLVKPSEVPLLLPAADVVVHPSYREGLARALPQGLLASKAVVSYDCDGAAEVCVPGVTGTIVRTGDAAGLGAAMRALAADADMREAMGRRGRELCMARFPAEVMVAGIERVYERVARQVGLAWQVGKRGSNGGV